MKEVKLDLVLQARLKKLYEEMEAAYDNTALQLNFSCEGCDDNCCDSFFLHHTYSEWSYLWFGFQQLPSEEQQNILARCKIYIKECQTAEEQGKRPQVMCPLNVEGLCILYPYRLMVCRTHGVPASMTRPDGRKLTFPGCFRCQEIVQEKFPDEKGLPRMERTPLLQELAMIENDLFDGKRRLYPKVKLTIAQMLLQGAPAIETPHCER